MCNNRFKIMKRTKNDTMLESMTRFIDADASSSEINEPSFTCHDSSPNSSTQTINAEGAHSGQCEKNIIPLWQFNNNQGVSPIMCKEVQTDDQGINKELQTI